MFAATKGTVLAAATLLALLVVSVAGPAGGASSARGDRVAPTPPGNPHVTEATPSRVSLAWDPAQDNGFEGVYKALGTALSRSKVRNALRAVVRRRLEEERGEEPSADYRDDVQIQRAILEALRSLGRDPREIAAYRFLIGRIGQESRQPE